MVGTMTNPVDFPAKKELRDALRRTLVLPLEVLGEVSGKESCTAKNISLGGMFFQCTPAFGRTGDIVSLEFWLGFGGINKRCCMLVQIARVADDGFGVCYHQCDAASFRYVHKLMYERGASYREAFG